MGSFAALWFFLMEKDESEKGESEPLPEWPSYAVISVNVTAIMNRTDGQWTMTSSLKIIIMKSLHSLDTVDVPTFDLDT